MSFFDEADEPQPSPGTGGRQPRRPTRAGPRPPRRPPGRPPTGSSQQVQTRRLIAVGVIVVIVVAMALLIHGCQVSETNSSLKTYAGNVATWISRSNANGATMFTELKSGEAKSDIESLQEQLDDRLAAARRELDGVKALNVPSQMNAAQQGLVQTMQLRHDGIAEVTNQVENAVNASTSDDAVSGISQGMYMLAASDVDYKVLTAAPIAAALHNAGIAVGGTTGVPIEGGQILNDLGWLNKTSIAIWIGAQVSSQVANTSCPSLCGHMLNFVDADGQELDPYATNTVAASPAPTFTLNFTNGGLSNEYQVDCVVDIKALNDKGTATYPETKPGGIYDCDVKLATAPVPGLYTVSARILKVPGETNTKNNVQTYTIDFK